MCCYSKCDPLSENPAHRAFYENRDKTGYRCSNVQLCGKKKMEAISCLVPELQSEMQSGCGTQLSEQCFYVATVNFNIYVSVY